ncbi:Cation transport ATPase [Klebsormidium nitens]|uniref:Cation transport ATPase n=1 Tax=Klebsormidium nitens TaxID=105231 RepID=A0A0U9HHQ5_KLENI|nr:Cation transport ATPase [Klebsormidium nitens]|eukprot:GAQ77948.1 Cation transport ATPase [Klebsormidium nitens]
MDPPTRRTSPRRGAQRYADGVASEKGDDRSDEVVVLDVGGMSCGGCASAVKRILESQPEVSSATVNLATETALIQLEPSAESDGKKEKVAEQLAAQLTKAGFKSTLRVKKA